MAVRSLARGRRALPDHVGVRHAGLGMPGWGMPGWGMLRWGMLRWGMPGWGVLAWGVLAWGVLAWAAVAGDVAIADPQPQAQAQELTQLAEGSGRDLTVSRCIVCHSLEYIPSNAPAMNRTAWGKTIQKMRDRFGAPITDDEGRQILDYLATNYSGKP